MNVGSVQVLELKQMGPVRLALRMQPLHSR
jgi:hypothetical protein